MPAPWYKNTIIYGLDVARFYDSNGDGVGDLAGVTNKLDYLQDLGIDCIWLLPFFPSPRRDNGYDVADYKNVDPRFGSLEDFRELLTQAHARDIRIIIDLVMHHTSETHPWFQAAVADPSLPFHSYYVWAKEPDTSEKSIFSDSEDSAWEYVRPLNKYYHHRFYHFQPDLDISNPAVMAEIKEVIDFWLAFDVDGFRIDAATHMFEQKGESRAKIETGKYLEELREHAAKRKKDVALLGEADVKLHEVEEYSREGERLNMLFNFLLVNFLLISLVQENPKRLREHFHDSRPSHKHVTWVNFIRSHDEVDLEQLTKKERKQVLETLAPQENMRIFGGESIRRHITSMVKNEQQLRMIYSLLFSSPGTPMFLYGSEIGMGDDLTRTGRNSVRLPMQWSDAPYADFSHHEPAEIVGRAKEEGERGYKKVNVDAVRNDELSLWHFFRELIKVRRTYPSIDTAEYTLPDVGNAAILMIDYKDALMLHNFSSKEQRFTVPLKQTSVVFGEDCRKSQTLSGYGFSWLRKGIV